MRLHRVAAAVLALAVLAGCASTKVTDRQTYEGAKLARPDRIIVHDIATTPEDIPAGSVIAGQVAGHTMQQTPEQIALGRQMGAEIAKELVAEIRSWGLPAVRAAGQPAPRVNDIVLMGYFASVDSGSAVKRVVLGFGSGSAELKTAVEGYVMTDKGLRRLGSGDVDAGTGKAPGVAVPLVIAAATGNPIGFVVSSAAKVEGQVSGRTTVEGDAKRTAKEIAAQIKVACQKQGWI
jgi:outer membrane murein-binding lipoprotein Lpp